MRRNVEAARRKRIFVTFCNLGSIAKAVEANIIASATAPTRSMHGIRSRSHQKLTSLIQKKVMKMTKFLKKMLEMFRSVINYHNPRNLL